VIFTIDEVFFGQEGTAYMRPYLQGRIIRKVDEAPLEQDRCLKKWGQCLWGRGAFFYKHWDVPVQEMLHHQSSINMLRERVVDDAWFPLLKKKLLSV
jgi:hypothetical protein